MTAPGQTPHVSVVVVSFNTRELTRRCLESVADHPPSAPFEVVVIDNASGDGSADMVEADFPAVVLVRNAANVGFGPAVNAAVRRTRGDVVVLVNPDAEVLPGAFDALLGAVESGHDIVGGAALARDGRIDPSCCLGRPTLWGALCFGTGLSTAFPRSRVFATETLGGWDRRTSREVPAVSGCFVAYRKPVFAALGGFDETFFMYGEDVDLCLRAAADGSVTFYTPDAAVHHESGAASASRGDKLVLLMTGKASLITRHWHPAAQPLGRGLLQLGVGLRYLGHRVVARGGELHPHGAGWQTAWARRAAWRGGYPAPEAGRVRVGAP